MFLSDQSHNVIGQLRYLGSTERYTGHKVVLCVKVTNNCERGILGFVAGVAVEKASSVSERLAHESFRLIETIAQTFRSTLGLARARR